MPVSAIPARYALERGNWSAAAALVPRPDASPNTEAITRFARALGASRSGNPTSASSDIARLGELRDALSAKPDPYWAEQVDIQQRVAIAWQSFAEGRKTEAIAQLTAAARMEDKTDKRRRHSRPVCTSQRIIGRNAAADRPSKDALAAFEAVLQTDPNRFHALAGAGLAATAAGKRAKGQKILHTTAGILCQR